MWCIVNTHSLSKCTITTNTHRHIVFFSSFSCLPQPAPPFVQTQRKGILSVILLVYSSLGLDTGVRAQPLPHHASPSMGMRDWGRGLRVWRSTGLRRRRRRRKGVLEVVVVGLEGGGWHTSAARGERQAQRFGENEKRVARVSDKWHTQGGCAGEAGWNKCYRGARDCVFPMVCYPLPPPPPKSSSWTPTQTPRTSPLNAAELSLSLSLSRCPVKKGLGRLSFTPQARCVFNELIQMKKFNTKDGLPQPK